MSAGNKCFLVRFSGPAAKTNQKTFFDQINCDKYHYCDIIIPITFGAMSHAE
jgi:hypothetical protein